MKSWVIFKKKKSVALNFNSHNNHLWQANLVRKLLSKRVASDKVYPPQRLQSNWCINLCPFFSIFFPSESRKATYSQLGYRKRFCNAPNFIVSMTFWFILALFENIQFKFLLKKKLKIIYPAGFLSLILGLRAPQTFHL